MRQQCKFCEQEKGVPIRIFLMASLSYKIPNHKISKFPNNSQTTRNVSSWDLDMQIQRTQFAISPNKIPNHKIPKFLTISGPLEYLQSEPRHANTKDAVRSFATPSVLPQYFPNAIKKFPNQMLRNIPRMDFNAGFARYNTVGRSRMQ